MQRGNGRVFSRRRLSIYVYIMYITHRHLHTNILSKKVKSVSQVLEIENFKNFVLAQVVKNLPTMQETWVQSLGGEVSLEKGKDIHSNILAWRVPWTEEPGGLQSMGVAKSLTQLSDLHSGPILPFC